MPKTLNLTQTYIHSGKHYGPGVVENVADAVAADIDKKEREHLQRVAREKAEREAALKEAQADAAKPARPRKGA
jgi:hypothetical protein